MTWQALQAFSSGMLLILDQMYDPENEPNWLRKAKDMISELEAQGHIFNDYDRALIECYFARYINLRHIDIIAYKMKPKPDIAPDEYGSDLSVLIISPHVSQTDFALLTPGQRLEEHFWFPENV
jgi:hypothetical protein